MDSVVWCRSLVLLSLNHDFERRSKSFTLGKPQASLGLLSLNHDFFAVDDVDAGRKIASLFQIISNLDAV